MPLTTYTAGEVLTAASLNANLSFAASSPASGLTYITGATFTTVASVSLPAATFSATYRMYRVMWVVNAVSTSLNFTARFRIAGADNTAANYKNGFIGRTNIASTYTGDQNSTSSFEFGGSDSGNAAPKFLLDVIDPQRSEKTYFAGSMVSGGTSAGGIGGGVIGGLFNDTTVFDSMTLIASTGTITGYYRVYGYSES